MRCSRCPNDTINPTIWLTESGLCNVCRQYDDKYDGVTLLSELRSIANGRAMIGMSGGKDSTATAYAAKRMGLDLTAFTFDIGHYPEHIPGNAAYCAKLVGIPHELIDIRQYISPSIRRCYKMTAQLYDNDHFDARALYVENRRHYSVRDNTVMPFVRSCQICRKVVIPAYYAEAVKRNIVLVILGMNEWTHLNTISSVSGLRVLQPSIDQPKVVVVHLPFLLRWNISITTDIVSSLGWSSPDDRLISTNSNSCLFARAAERKAFNMLGFHPDTTRLAREVTCGFLTLNQAQSTLSTIADYDRSVKSVLTDADII